MATSYTPRLGLPEMADGEGSGYVTFNDLARILDAILQPSVVTATVTTPPGSPADGDVYYVPSGSTGDWAGHDGELAQWYDGLWYFRAVPIGFDLHSQETDLRWTTGRYDPYLGHVSVGHAGLVTQNPGGETPQNITTTTTKINTFNAKMNPSVDASASIADSTITFSEAGWWFVTVLHSLIVVSASANQSREWIVEFYNETDAVPVTDGLIGVGSISKDQVATEVSNVFVVAVSSAMVGKEFSLHMTSLGSTIVVSEILSSRFSVARISHSEIVPGFVTSD